MNFRARIAVLCAFFLAPLFPLLLFQSERTRSDLVFLGREINDVAALRAIWPEVRAQAGVGERAVVERIASVTSTVILDPYSETYHRAGAVTSDLVVLALGLRDDPAERTRIAHRASLNFTQAATSLPDDTARDLADLLAERRDAMLQKLMLGVVLVGGSVRLGVWMAISLARGLSRRITQLVAQIDRLTENDTSGVTPFLDDRHDMGRIARGVDALRLSLIDARDAWSQVLVNEMRASLLSDHTRALVLRTDKAGKIASPRRPAASWISIRTRSGGAVEVVKAPAEAASGELDLDDVFF